MKAEKKREFTLRITNANRTELIVILYEMCFEYLEDAAKACEARDVDGVKDAVRKGQKTIRQLEYDLDFKYELSLHLMSLYAFAEKELVRCIIDLRAEHARDVRKILTPLYEGFLEIAKKDDSAPLMGNTETVYAGMTYGRRTLNEAVGTSSRGFFA